MPGVQLPGISTRLLLDTTGFQSSVQTATSHIGGLQQASQSAMGVLSGIGNAISGFVIGKGLMDLPAVMEGAAQKAVAAEADQIRLKQAVLNTGASWESQSANIDAATAKARQMGFAMGDARASLANMTATTGSADEAQKRLSLAMDLSRGTGLDLTTASRLLGKVTDENVNVLARYGIHMEKGADATELFAAIQQKFGGQAEAFAGTATGQMQQYQAVMDSVTAQLGQAFLPILTLSAQFMASVMVPIVQQLVVPALAQIATWSKTIGAVISNEFMPIWRDLVKLLVGDVAQATGGVGTSFKGIGDTIGSYLRPAVDVLRDSFRTIIQVFQGNWSPSPEINGVTNAIGIAATLVRDVVLPAFQTFIGFINDHKDVIAAFAIGFAAFAILGPIVTAISGFVAAISGIGAVVAGASGAIGGLGAVIALLGGPVTIIAAAIGLLALAWINDWGGIQEKTKAVLDFIGPYISTALGAIQQFWTDHGAQIQALAKLAWDFISTYIGNTLRIIGDVFTIALALLSGDWSTAWTGIKDLVSTTWDQISLVVSTAFDALNILSGGKLGELVTGYSLAWSAISTAIGEVWNGATGIVSTIGAGLAAVISTTKGALSGNPDALADIWFGAWDLIGNTITKVFGPADPTSLPGLISAGLLDIVGITKSYLSGDSESVKAYAELAFTDIKAFVDTTFGAGTGDTITGILTAGWNAFKALTEAVFGAAGGSARSVFEGAMNAFKTAMDPISGMLDTITTAIDQLKRIMPDWLIPHSPTPFEIGLRGIADAAKSMSDAFSGVGSGTDLLKQIGAMATGMGGLDFGRAAASIMGAETEGGTYLHQIGGTGAVGPFMFDPGGELRNFAAAMKVSVSEAATIAMTKPMVAAQWALQGYLGDAIRRGMSQGLTGRDLAIFGEKYGERPAEGLETRAGDWYDRLFKAAGGGIFSQPTAVLLGEAGTEGVFNAQQMRWLGGALGSGGTGRQPIHVTVKLGGRTLADAWVEGRTEAQRTRGIT